MSQLEELSKLSFLDCFWFLICLLSISCRSRGSCAARKKVQWQESNCSSVSTNYLQVYYYRKLLFPAPALVSEMRHRWKIFVDLQMCLHETANACGITVVTVPTVLLLTRQTLYAKPELIRPTANWLVWKMLETTPHSTPGMVLIAKVRQSIKMQLSSKIRLTMLRAMS